MAQKGNSGYNSTMHRFRRFAPQLLAVTCMAFVLVSLSPGSPAYGHDQSRVHSVRVHAYVEQVLYEASAPLDISVAVFTPRPWQYSSAPSSRAFLAAPTLAFQGSLTTCDLLSPPDYVERPMPYKYRRYACQILDLPPPSMPTCTL